MAQAFQMITYIMDSLYDIVDNGYTSAIGISVSVIIATWVAISIAYRYAINPVLRSDKVKRRHNNDASA